MAKTFEIKDGDISDGYHTFGELYEHRCLLFLYVCREVRMRGAWKRDSATPGWICVYLETENGQISYHVPDKYLGLVPRHFPQDQHYKWDGHTSEQVLERLYK